MSVILSKYGSAVVLADMAFNDKEYFPGFFKYKLKKVGTVTKLVINPKYPYKTAEEERIARHKHEQKRRTFIINYLNEHYPDTDYAERYNKENKWNLPLRMHTEETKKCSYLNEDGRHCNRERECTTCYTCCFSCVLPDCNCMNKVCEFNKCNE